MRWMIVVAELCSESTSQRSICTSRLQLDRWHACHFLHLNLRPLGKTATIDASQVEELRSASGSLPLLRCMQLVGRDYVSLTESSIEGTFLRLVARHASVMSLHVKTVDMPLDFLPKLQHLLLDLDTYPTREGTTQFHESLFSAISMLGSLRTLYLESTQNPLHLGKTI